jgi:hypothetical protein
MPNDDPLEVVCCVHELHASKRVARALKAERLAPVQLEWKDLAVKRKRSHTWAAMVYDLEPRDGRTADVIQQFRENTPAGPILLYTSPAHDIGPFLERHILYDLVLVSLQCSTGVCETGRLREDLRRLVAEIPRHRLIKMMSMAFPAMPQCMMECARETIQWLCTPKSLPQMTTQAIAHKMGVTPRTLERSVSNPQFPKPKELINWVTLLYVTLIARCENVSPGLAGHRMGLSGNALCRIRKRLLSDDESVLWKCDGKDPAAKFPLVFQAFVKRCGLPSAMALEIMTDELSEVKDVRSTEWARAASA